MKFLEEIGWGLGAWLSESMEQTTRVSNFSESRGFSYLVYLNLMTSLPMHICHISCRNETRSDRTAILLQMWKGISFLACISLDWKLGHVICSAAGTRFVLLYAGWSFGLHKVRSDSVGLTDFIKCSKPDHKSNFLVIYEYSCSLNRCQRQNHLCPW